MLAQLHVSQLDSLWLDTKERDSQKMKSQRLGGKENQILLLIR